MVGKIKFSREKCLSSLFNVKWDDESSLRIGLWFAGRS